MLDGRVRSSLFLKGYCSTNFTSPKSSSKKISSSRPRNETRTLSPGFLLLTSTGIDHLLGGRREIHLRSMPINSCLGSPTGLPSTFAVRYHSPGPHISALSRTKTALKFTLIFVTGNRAFLLLSGWVCPTQLPCNRFSVSR